VQRVHFVLTSEGDDSDEDLYLSVDRQRQPGKDDYDFKSTSWAGTVSPDASRYPHVEGH
jgi:hypothetical protein